MTKQEFMEKLRAVDKMADANYVFTSLAYNDDQEVAEISNEDYLTIETVYTHHPAISDVFGKIQIAQIYAYGGMGVIRDMLPTAIKARQIESQLREIKSQERNLLAQLEELKTGREYEGALV